jgi:hypothetical protein
VRISASEVSRGRGDIFLESRGVAARDKNN